MKRSNTYADLRPVLRLLMVFFSVCFFIAVFQGCGKKEEQESGQEVKVAANLPLSGPFGIYGQTVRDGALFALEDLEKENTDIKISLDIQDNTGKPATTVSVMQKQLMKPVDIYTSGVKPQTMSIFDQVKEKGLPHIVWIFDAFICAKNDNTFRTWVSFKYEPEKYLQYIKCKNFKKIAIAYVNVPHVHEEMQEILMPGLEQAGIGKEDIFTEIFEWNEKDFKNVVAKVKDFSPDLIILSAFHENIVALVRLLRAYDMIKDGNVIGTYDTLDAAEVLTAEELEGIRLIVPEFSVTGESSKFAGWKERFTEKFGNAPLYTHAYGYDMVRIIADAAERVSPPKDSAAWITAIQETDTDGVTGRLVFDPDGDLKLTLRIGVYRQGKLEIDDCDDH